jgi:putative transposase
MAGEGLPVEVACRVLGVSCAGFYAWRFRPPSARAVRHAWLTDLIREIHAGSYGAYGAPRVHAELVLGRGIRVGHCSVAMLMQRAGIQGRTGSPKRRGMPGIATAEDLVDRVFHRNAPNQLWDRRDRAPDPGGQGLLRGRAGRVQPSRRRLVDQSQPDRRTDDQALGMAICGP